MAGLFLLLIVAALFGPHLWHLFLSAEQRMEEEKQSPLPQTTCPTCGEEHDVDFTVCPHCGYDHFGEAVCPYCGFTHDPRLDLCPTCGYEYTN